MTADVTVSNAPGFAIAIINTFDWCTFCYDLLGREEKRRSQGPQVVLSTIVAFSAVAISLPAFFLRTDWLLLTSLWLSLSSAEVLKFFRCRNVLLPTYRKAIDNCMVAVIIVTIVIARSGLALVCILQRSTPLVATMVVWHVLSALYWLALLSSIIVALFRSTFGNNGLEKQGSGRRSTDKAQKRHFWNLGTLLVLAAVGATSVSLWASLELDFLINCAALTVTSLFGFVIRLWIHAAPVSETQVHSTSASTSSQNRVHDGRIHSVSADHA